VSYVIGAVVGFLYGTLISYINARLTANYIEKNKNEKQEEKAVSSSGFSAGRQIINICALVLVFLLQNVLPFSFYACLIGTIVALAFMSYFFLFRLGKKS